MVITTERRHDQNVFFFVNPLFTFYIVRQKREWWARSDLNRGPSDYESPALTAELRAQTAPQNYNYRRSLAINCVLPLARMFPPVFCYRLWARF